MKSAEQRFTEHAEQCEVARQLVKEKTPEFAVLMDEEPDFFRFTWSGYDCMIVRNQRGLNLCGYVGVPWGHPLYGLDYSSESIALKSLAAKNDKVMWNVKERAPSFSRMCDALFRGKLRLCPESVLEVHGGITFADRHYIGDKRLWYFGFDCAHAGDLSPGHEAKYRELGLGATLGADGYYRSFFYVKNETRLLAEQLLKIQLETPWRIRALCILLNHFNRHITRLGKLYHWTRLKHAVKWQRDAVYYPTAFNSFALFMGRQTSRARELVARLARRCKLTS